MTRTLLLSMLAVLTACASPPPATSTPSTGAQAAPIAWDFEGSRIIGCCCMAPCPCRINKKPTYCHGCHFTEAIHVEKGHIGDVRVDGLDYAIVGRGFGEESGAGWSHIYVSDRATDAQYDALQKLMVQNVGALGPKAKYLAGDFLGFRKVPMTYTISADRREYGVTVPGVLTFSTRAITNPGRTEPVVSTGVLDSYGDRFVHAETLVHKLDDAKIQHSWDLAGRQANQADFVVGSTRVAAGGIGWGCWSAHAELGDTAPYPETQTAGGHAHK